MRRHLLLALLLPLLLSGCGVKLVYNNLDRIIPWVADDYIKFDDRQEEYFDAELASILYWHRTTQLPEYALALRRFDADVADGLTLEELLIMEEQVLEASHLMRARFVPMATEILYSTTPQQLLDIKRRFDRRNAKYLKPIANLDMKGERQRWGRDFQDGFEFFVGRASPEQRERIAKVATVYVPEERMWIEYRERWQHSVFALMDLELSYPELLGETADEFLYSELSELKEKLRVLLSGEQALNPPGPAICQRFSWDTLIERYDHEFEMLVEHHEG